MSFASLEFYALGRTYFLQRRSPDARVKRLFRLGIAALYLVIPLDIVVGWALYRVFSPVSKSLSMLAATLRVAFAVVFMVAISRLVDVLRLLRVRDVGRGPNLYHGTAILRWRSAAGVAPAGRPGIRAIGCDPGDWPDPGVRRHADEQYDEYDGVAVARPLGAGLDVRAAGWLIPDRHTDL